MANYINKDIYAPLIEKFYKEAAPYYGCGYPYGPFIPYTMPRYPQAGKKIVYIGRDTYYWAGREALMKSMRDGKPEDYLTVNSKVLKPEDIVNGYNNNSGSFWNFVAKLHLLIRTGHYYDDIRQTGADELRLIEEIGYGNLNSIELPKTLENEGTLNEITSMEDYGKLRNAGQVFEKIKTILEAYHPDLIVILNWEERDDIFDGLHVHWQKDYYIDARRAVYTIDGYATRIIWTSHPRRFSFLKTNPQEMAGLLYDTVKLL